MLAADVFPYERSVAFVIRKNPRNLTLTENSAGSWYVIWKSVCRVFTEGMVIVMMLVSVYMFRATWEQP